MRLYCPDLGASAPDGVREPFLHLGAGAERHRKRGHVAFRQCPNWWTRRTADWPGRAPESLLGLSPFAFAREKHGDYEAGNLGALGELPGRLRDLIVLYGNEVGKREQAAHDARMAEANRKRGAARV